MAAAAPLDDGLGAHEEEVAFVQEDVMAVIKEVRRTRAQPARVVPSR